jgi:chromosome segregation ATPase
MEHHRTPSSDKQPPAKEQVQIPDNPASFCSQSDCDRNQRPPPMQEVLLNNDEDTFFEDRSLEQRTQRTLVTTPLTKSSPDHDNRISTAQRSPLSTVQSSPPGSLTQQHQPQLEQLPRLQQPQEDTTEQQRDASLYSSGDISSLQVLIRMKEELARAYEKLKTIEQANQLLAGERDSLSRQLEAQQVNEQAHVTELKVNLSRQQGVLDTLRSQKEEWQQEKSRFDEKVRVAAREKKDLMHKRLASDNRQKELKLQLDHLQGQLTAVMAEKTTLQEGNGRLRQETTSLAKANSELQQKISTILEQGAQAVQSREEAEQEMKARQEEKEAHQAELERLQQALEETKQEYKDVQESLHEEKRALETSLRTTEEKLQQVNESTQQEIEKLQKSVHESKETIQHLRSSQAALRASGGTSSLGRVVGSGLRSTTFGTVNTGNNHALNNVRFQKEGVPTTTGGSSVSSINTSLKNVASFDPSAITERLARIRDSSERAALIRTYTREIARLKEENEATAKTLEASHSEALRRARKHADLKLETRLHELKTSLSQEYDEKLEELESRHRQQVAEVRVSQRYRSRVTVRRICKSRCSSVSRVPFMCST